MKEFIDKLIERLEKVYAMNDKLKKSAYEEEDWEKFDLLSGRNQSINMAISIVNELAGKYKEIRENAIDECIKVIEETVWKDTDMLVESIRELKEGGRE